ncbi:MAG: SDR family NAD(P)-dependent oxidoreductase [Candidatus Omnitrophica bacterium]|nr:SDR family NAD(P)-dependent oxidoreductase [Candidatus Omnitrophota bacterium]
MAANIEIANRKKVIITGAGGRVGRVFVKNALIDENIYPVIFTSQTEIFSDIGLDKGLVVDVDLKEPESIKQAVNLAYQRLGRLDVLINNAAFMQSGLKDFIKESVDSSIADVFKVNAMAPIYCIKSFLAVGDNPKLVINILAGRACEGHKSHIDYYASKAALLSATRSFSLGYPQHRFRALMLRKIAVGEQTGDTPDSIWEGIQKDIRGIDKSRYREVYYGNKALVLLKSIRRGLKILTNIRYDKAKRIVYRPLEKLKKRWLGS